MDLLPVFQTADRILSQLQTRWAAILNPLLSTPMLSGTQLTGVNLASGSNNINHLLGRKQQGWFITDITTPATIYRSQAFNDKTLTLTSNAVTTVNLWVF